MKTGRLRWVLAVRWALAGVCCLVAAGGLAGQTTAPPGEGGFTYSLGLPQHGNWHAGLSLGTLFSLHTYNGQTDVSPGLCRRMITDGDAMVLCSGLPALSPLLDFAELEGLSQWIETQAELDGLIPPVQGFCRLLARWEKLAL